MDPVLLARFARQALIFAGGILVAKGVISDAQVSGLVDSVITGAGALMTVTSVGWSIYRHFRPTPAMVIHTLAAAPKVGG